MSGQALWQSKEVLVLSQASKCCHAGGWRISGAFLVHVQAAAAQPAALEAKSAEEAESRGCGSEQQQW